MMKKFLFILFTIYISSCNINSSDSILLKIEAGDSCYQLNEPVSRQLTIVENTFEDTTALGYAILLPKYTGDFTYYRSGEGAIDPKTPKRFMPKTETICINSYLKRKPNGYIVIKLDR